MTDEEPRRRSTDEPFTPAEMRELLERLQVMESLDGRVHAAKNAVMQLGLTIEVLTHSVDEFTQKTDLDKRIETKVEEVTTRQQEQTRVVRWFAIAFLLLLGMLAFSSQRLDAQHSCEQRNGFRDELALVIETSFENQQVDLTLVPPDLQGLIAASAERSRNVETRLLDGLEERREECNLLW